MPPTFQRYISWGFSDESIKIGYTDNEKSYISFENVQEGAIFSCCSPDSKTIITAGTSTTINVWELNKHRQRRLQLKARLYGHLDTVTCMAVSSAYHLLVSGSRDQTCIIWDINSWTFVRQLSNHYAAVSYVCINELTVIKTFIYFSKYQNNMWTANHADRAKMNITKILKRIEPNLQTRLII